MSMVFNMVGGCGGGKPKKLLSSLTEGSLVSVLEAGKLVPFYVAKHNYEADLNGEGRTLLMRKTSYDSRAFNSSNVNALATSALYAWMNGEYKSMLSGTVQGEIGTTSYPNTESGGKAAITGRGAVFLASLTEFGLKDGSGSPVEGTALPLANQLYICYDASGNAVSQWTRTPVENDTQRVYYASSAGTAGAVTATSSLAVRPCFTLPADMALNTEPYGDGSWGLVDEADITPETTFPQLLWTNASPTSTFAPQTVNLSGANFDAYIIEIRYTTSISALGYGLVYKLGSVGGAVGNHNSTHGGLVMRTMDRIDDNSILFSTGFNRGSADNSYGIPTRIWGVNISL